MSDFEVKIFNLRKASQKGKSIAAKLSKIERNINTIASRINISSKNNASINRTVRNIMSNVSGNRQKVLALSTAPEFAADAYSKIENALSGKTFFEYDKRYNVIKSTDPNRTQPCMSITAGVILGLLLFFSALFTTPRYISLTLQTTKIYN